ncbi:response regulator, partial [Vibrio parahaemolyticus V-223/04]
RILKTYKLPRLSEIKNGLSTASKVQLGQLESAC